MRRSMRSISSSSLSSAREIAATMSSSNEGIAEWNKKRSVGASACCAPGGSKLRMLTLCGVLSTVTNFPEGYCNSYPNTSHEAFKDMINDSYVHRGDENGISEGAFTWYWSLMLNIWFIGYLVGTFLTPYFNDNLGRKKALFIANTIGLVGAVLSFLAVLFSVPELLFISRIVASTSSGISFGSLILFLQEATPTHWRGVTSFLCESTFIATTAMGIGFGMDVIFGKNLPVLTGLSIIPGIISIIIVMPLYETPKFLLINCDNRAEALKALEFYRGVRKENEAVLEEMMLESEMGEKEEQVSIVAGIREVLSEGHLRIAFFLGITALQIIVGIWPIVYLSTDLLEANFSKNVSQIASFVFIMADFLASIGGCIIIERFNRRTLLLSLGVANTLSLCLYIASDLLIPLWNPIRWGQIVGLVLFGATYGIALGPIAFFITSELVPQRSRSIVQSMVFGFNTIMNFIFSFATLPAYTAFGVLSFLPLLVLPSSLCIVFLYFYLPETRGREVHDVVEELMAKHLKGYVAEARLDEEGGRRTATVSTFSTLSIATLEGQKETPS